MHISASQIATIQRCDREYLFKYIMKMAEEPSTALFMGTAFHEVVDTPELLATMCFPMLNESKYPYKRVISKMVKAHKIATQGLPSVTAKEVKISHRVGGVEVLGFVDAVRSSQDSWYLSERKTAGRIETAKQLYLKNEIQVAGYISARDVIAAQLDLNLEAFQGLTYETAEKPQQRMGKRDTPDLFALRATSKAVVWTVPASEYAHCRKVFHASVTWADERREKISRVFGVNHDMFEIPGNTAACTRWGQKCSYFKVCHGAGVSDADAENDESTDE